jgi:hypothetical protein
VDEGGKEEEEPFEFIPFEDYFFQKYGKQEE